jgi:uncharacterized protein (TIGR02271 family)
MKGDVKIMKSVLALYDNSADAHEVVQELQDAGFHRDHISIATHSGEYGEYLDDDGRLVYDDEDVSAGEGAAVGAVGGGILGLLAGLGAMAIPGVGPILAAGPLAGALVGAGAGAVTGGVVGGLIDMGVPEEDAGYYAEGIRRGGTLVSVRTDDDMANEAAAIMNRYNPVDLDSRAASWQEAGWTGYDADADYYDTDMIATERDSYSDRRTNYTMDRDVDMDIDREVDGERVIPVVEEEIRVGKRTVQRGGVRVHTDVEEMPVEEDVTLREEHVRVERRPVDRAATDADFVADSSGVIEMTETAEEVVVDKQARVIEEVVISKDVDTHTETVRDTVRRTDVEVEELGTERVTDRDYDDFTTYETRFREDFDTNYRDSGYTWDQYRPAYQYGYSLGTHPRYSSSDWATIEPEARREWETRNEGTWEDFKDSVRRGWNEVREEVRQRT